MRLSHEDKDKTRSTYRRATCLAKRRDMMQACANWLDGIERQAGMGRGTEAAFVNDR
ncbi:hypothetical protein [Burkholderia latens]|uniref:hypothetical protein n=1 Tax=Burkholderia latens TaxID=488446 RepID=UPI001478EE8D|nr:hypothetical protein [Burkholderia latens]